MWTSRVHRCGEAHRLVQTGAHRWNTQIAEVCRQITHTEEAHSQVTSHTQSGEVKHTGRKSTVRWCTLECEADRQVMHTDRSSTQSGEVRYTGRRSTQSGEGPWSTQKMHTCRWCIDGWSTQTGEAWNINTGTAHRQVKLTTQASESLPGWTVSGSASSLGCRRRPQSRRRTERRRWSGGMLQMGAGSPEIKGQTLSASASSVQSQPQAH